jgi:hypothetical protein
MPDAIGHGQSSKPSDGLRARFPRYGYIDIVEAQYRLINPPELGILEREIQRVPGSNTSTSC